MYKRLKYIILSTLFIGFTQCEVDDICLEEVLTPKLKIKFYDTDNPETLQAPGSLYVWADEKDSLYMDYSKDSILIPLNSNASTTRYLLSKAGLVDTLDINYEVIPVFVSRSCGYKYNFAINELPDFSTEWISDVQMTNVPQTINSENEIHVQIYH
jgi:hypothetical protein